MHDLFTGLGIFYGVCPDRRRLLPIPKTDNGSEDRRAAVFVSPRVFGPRRLITAFADRLVGGCARTLWPYNRVRLRRDLRVMGFTYINNNVINDEFYNNNNIRSLSVRWYYIIMLLRCAIPRGERIILYRYKSSGSFGRSKKVTKTTVSLSHRHIK